jgi:transcriptional regulator with GAF, ATPase, and Fis domain
MESVMKKILAAQRIVQDGVVVEQSIRVFSPADLPTCLDVLLDHFRGKNVIRATVRALVLRALERSGGQQKRAAEMLGVSTRMMCYHHKQLSKGEQNEES